MSLRAFLGSCVSSTGAVSTRVARPLLILSIVLLAMIRSVAPTQAATLTVTDCTAPNVFLGDLSAASSGDTISFACTGTIALTAPIPISQTLTIIGVGQSVTLSGGNATQLFSVSSNLTLDNLTITGGNASGNGGAIASTTASAAITANNVTFIGNTAAGSGGAIDTSAAGGSITVNNSTFNGNKASGNGGAIAASGALTVTNSTFTGNTAANHSGAIDANAPPPPNDPTSVITGSTFTANQAAYGGAMALGFNNPAAITNSTYTGNSASTDGDALFTYASLSLSFDTIAGNTGGGSTITFSSGSSSFTPGFTAAGTILDNAANCSSGGTIVDKGSNLTYQSGNCGLTLASDVNADPQLSSLAGNSGPTQTMAVSSSSPAVGAAPCVDVAGKPVRTDQRGAGRPVSACTIGAYEAGQINDTWLNAIPLGNVSAEPSYQVNQTMSQQQIYTATQERWYKFPVTPGSQVNITYQGDPGAVVSLHADLPAAYNALTNPTNAAVQSAQSAPSEFLPSEFLPSEFLPSEFLPSEFLPSEFLPSEFLPSEFLPSEFLPSEFLPSEFLPSEFLPAGYQSGPYSGAILGSVLAVSDTPNTTVQTISHNTWNTFGSLYVRVIEPAGHSAPFSLNVTEKGGVCSGVTNIAATAPASGSIPSGLTSLILWDPSRIAGSASDISTLSGKLATFAGRPEVTGTVIDLSQNPGIESAQAQADSNPTCPLAKNIVAGDIKSVIQAYRAQNPNLKYIVLVGDDHSIPFFRYPDESGLGPENQYYPPVADSSAANASLRDNYVLGQDEYGSATTLPVGDVSLPIPGLAVGRLVSTASEVSHMLDVYTAANGMLTPSSSLVTGYDFVADAACNAAAQLAAGIGSAPDTLIEQSAYTSSPCPTQTTAWTANDVSQKLLGSRHDIVFLAGHFSAGNLEAADSATTLSAAAVASSTVDMSNSLILALGCHGGYNIPGGAAIAGVSPSPDWPEAFAEKGATLLATTGYAYGDTVLTEYGEHLFDNYVQQLRSYSGASYVPVAAGQADVAAKKEYLAAHTSLSGIDEKTLLETTLYGLPMLQVNMTGQHLNTQPDTSIVSSAPTVSSGPGSQVGLGSADVAVQPSLTSHPVSLTNSATNTSVTATYLTGPNNGEVARPGEPIFPSQSFNVHVSNQILRGVGFRGGSYSDTSGITPLTSAVGTETSVGHPAFYSNVFYPNQVWTANYFDAINGGAERLVTTPAQYVSASPGSTSGTLRQFSDLQFRLFYLPSNWTSTPSSQTALAAIAPPPTITSVSATTGGNSIVTYNVHVSSDQLVTQGTVTQDTQDVWITYTSPGSGTWQSIDLTPSGTDPTLWTATQNLPSGILPSDIQFMVQAVNGTGLVSLSTNSGQYYRMGTPPATTSTTISVTSAPSSGTYDATTGTFTAHLQDNNGTALSGQVVTLQVGGQQAFGTTDGSGNAGITLPLNQPPGSYPVSATFSGSTAYGASSSGQAGTFTVNLAPTTLSLAPASGATADYSDPAGVTATLTDGSGNPLTQRTVLFTVTGNGQTYNTTGITDSQGHATLGPVPLPAGTYSVAASFGGQITTPGGSSVTVSDPDYQNSAAPTPASLTITSEESTAAYNGDTVIPVSSPLHLSATVSQPNDNNPNDLSQAQVQFVVTDPSGTQVISQAVPVTLTNALNGTAAITVPGLATSNVYTVTTTAVGSRFTSPPISTLLAVYNPSGGFVTGGGWITSQPAWCQLSSCSSTAGKANFGFNSRYTTGTTVPTGQLEFQLKGLDLESTSYQWMTISGNRVQFQGTGTVNGAGSYNFMLTALDSDMGGPQNGTDYFRIKIWNPSTGAVIYDSQPGAPDTSTPTTPLGSGNIVVHSS